MEAKLSAIPLRFKGLELGSLKPDLARHQNQAEAIQIVQANPEGSFVLSGRNGAGKSMLGWCLYREAALAGRKCFGLTLSELLAEYRRAETSQEDWQPQLTSVGLQQPHIGKALILLDEIDKARPSEFAAEQFFLLLNAIRNYRHQLIVTTNLHFTNLLHYWGRYGAAWGSSIGSRLAEDSHRIDLF